MAISGNADMIVNYQFSIDNDVTGGPDTSMYNSSWGVVEVFIENYNLHTESQSHICYESDSFSHDEGAVGFGCHFYSLDFTTGGSWTQTIEVTDDSTATCVLTIGAKPEMMRIFGTAKGLFGTKGDQGLSNSKVVAAKMDKNYYEQLSVSKPEFIYETATSDNQTADYEFNFTKGSGKPPKMMVVSLLWHDGTPEFAIANGEMVDGRRIPVYQALCVDEDPATKCAKWKKTSDGYEAEVNFEYGSEEKLLENWQIMMSEDWRGMGRTAGGGSVPQGNTTKIMADAAYMYYESEREMKYIETLSLQDPLNPLLIRAHDIDPDCLSTDSPGAWFNHMHAALSVNPYFGDLGTFLNRVEAKGGEVVMCTTGGNSSLEYYSAPDLPLWHEIGHYLLFQMYNPYTPVSNKPHAGYYVNNDTNDAIIEGFAGFVTVLVDEYYNDPYNDHAPPYVYGGDNIELDIKIWGLSYNPDFNTSEEDAVVGILWDFYDRGLEINRGYFRNGTVTGTGSYVGGTLTPVSRVYPQAEDRVSLDASIIMRVIDRNQVKTLVDLYNAFVSERRIGSIDMDMIYISHGVYADVIERNFIHDSTSEKIGESGSTSGPLRPARYTPPPEIAGSYIVSDTSATFNITINFVDELGYYDYSYFREAKPGEKMYFTMPPEYYPSVATISPVATAVGMPESEVVTIRSDEYWNYISSNPSKEAVFRQISLKSDATNGTTTAIQYIQKIRDELSGVSSEYSASNVTAAQEHALAAHREYLEHLKTELEQRNATELSEKTDQMLRVELFGLIRDGADAQSIDDQIAAINMSLDEAIVIVPEFPITPIGILGALIAGLGYLSRTRFFAR
jgi:hypothetical protein